MPFIHIKSLPLNKAIDVRVVIEKLVEDFARETGTQLKHITATWEYFQSDHYAVAGKTAPAQANNSHPVLVDLLAPDSNSPADVEQMLVALASSIALHTSIAQDNIFINYRKARSGMVFDSGKVVRW